VIGALSPVLVANRGEIAIRVMRTCRRLGVRTVAVFSDADARSRHVLEADVGVHIGGSPAAESYLNPARILEAARSSGARAIHPGHGFLSENADFADKVIDAGLVWIGPPPAAMRALGDKARAKALAEQHHVPVLAGYHGTDQSHHALRAQAQRVGYPLMIKASAGGGGRGMRVVSFPEDFDAALEAARREAYASFGDDRVLLERYVPRPRHVEVQIVGDAHGSLIHLGERECSVQRRHQKLIEETPSPAVDHVLREQMGASALRLARAAGYRGAGTVEFLLDADATFAFLEVNARLQVEHPVTEAVTGLDLVELQLRVASGEPLGLAQSDVRLDGHAIEARVIAEDPLAGFLPSSGTVQVFRFSDSLRVDTWVRDNTTVSPFYDSLLAKVIAHGADRAASVGKLSEALRGMRVEGVRHNVDLLLATVETPAFRRGELDTGFLEEHHVVEELRAVPSAVLAAAAALDHLVEPPASDPWQARGAWRQARLGQPTVWTRAAIEHAARVSAVEGVTRQVLVEIDGEHLHVHRGLPDGRVLVGEDGVTVQGDADFRAVVWGGRTYRLERRRPVRVDDVARDRGAGGESGVLTAPMPGRIAKLAVRTGQQVAQNEPLLVLEAMKMEHLVEAPHAASVAEIHVREGEQVSAGALLLTLGEPDAAPVQ
jgi:3-methylcrotonyl-CoA carboxylase alpha subunit